MAAPKTFRVRERRNVDGSTSYYARFTDQHGMRREFPLGRSPDWTATRALQEMEYIKADVERGTWRAESARRLDSRVVPFREIRSSQRSADGVCDLTWADVDLERRIIRVGGTKTSAAARDVNIVDGLQSLLELHRETTGFGAARDPVWPTANGTHRDRNNLNQRIIRPVVARARELVAEDEVRSKEEGTPRRVDIVLAPRITPHTFRRTLCAFATWEARDPYYVQQQMGHRDAKFTQAVYNRVQSWTGELDRRVLRWMRRPTREAPESRLMIVS
jgi:integrase